MSERRISVMAMSVVVMEKLGGLVINGLCKLIIKEAALTATEEMVRAIEDELELHNLHFPDFDKAVASAEVENIRLVMLRARDVLITYSRTVSERKMVAIKRKPAQSLKLRSMIKEVHRVHDMVVEANSKTLGLELRDLSHDGESSDDVRFELRRLLFYFLLFPAGSKIPARRLIALWIAEGLILPKIYDSDSVEDIGERYLNELINADLVSVVVRKSNGKVKTCELNGDDGRRESWLARAKEEHFLPDQVEDVRRLVDSSSAAGPSSIRILGDKNIYDSVPKYRDLISFLSFDDKQGCRERDDIGFFINKCILAGCFQRLKVIDLERVFRPVLPETISELGLLKYLGLRWTYLKDLPVFVKGLLNLEVLDVKHTYITILPASIWRMQYLRHLYLSEAFRTRFPRPISTISLRNLQTLWGAFVDEDTCVKGGLDSLVSIRKLGLSCGSKHKASSATAKQLEAISKWISNLKLLESLSLKSRDVDGKPDHLHLTSLEMNTNLSTVYLLGKLNPSVVCEFPVSLTDITLSGSELEVDPLEFLERLPNLQALRLLGRSVKHTRIRCSTRGFPVLKFFCIWKLENLEELEVGEGSVACLEELDIRSCHRMQSPPSGLPSIRTLKKFKVATMCDAFKDQARLLLLSLELSITDLDQLHNRV